MFGRAKHDDASSLKAVLMNQVEKLCGIASGQTDASVRRRCAQPRRGISAVKSDASRKEDGVGHRRPIILARIPHPVCRLRLEGTYRRWVAVNAGRNWPDAHDGVTLQDRELLRAKIGLQYQGYLWVGGRKGQRILVALERALEEPRV